MPSDPPAGFIGTEPGLLGQLLQQVLISRLQPLGGAEHDLGDSAPRERHAAEFGQNLGGLGVGQAQAFVEQDHSGLGRGADLTGGGAGGVGRL